MFPPTQRRLSHGARLPRVSDATGRPWWWMVYSYDAGGGNELRKPEISVSATTAQGPSTFTLTWALDTCAQANHGC